jgi:hypothetical protein
LSTGFDTATCRVRAASRCVFYYPCVVLAGVDDLLGEKDILAIVAALDDVMRDAGNKDTGDAGDDYFRGDSTRMERRPAPSGGP